MRSQMKTALLIAAVFISAVFATCPPLPQIPAEFPIAHYNRTILSGLTNRCEVQELALEAARTIVSSWQAYDKTRGGSPCTLCQKMSNQSALLSVATLTLDTLSEQSCRGSIDTFEDLWNGYYGVYEALVALNASCASSSSQPVNQTLLHAVVERDAVPVAAVTKYFEVLGRISKAFEPDPAPGLGSFSVPVLAMLDMDSSALASLHSSLQAQVALVKQLKRCESSSCVQKTRAQLSIVAADVADVQQFLAFANSTVTVRAFNGTQATVSMRKATAWIANLAVDYTSGVSVDFVGLSLVRSELLSPVHRLAHITPLMCGLMAHASMLELQETFTTMCGYYNTLAAEVC